MPSGIAPEIIYGRCWTPRCWSNRWRDIDEGGLHTLSRPSVGLLAVSSRNCTGPDLGLSRDRRVGRRPRNGLPGAFPWPAPVSSAGREVLNVQIHLIVSQVPE